MFHVESIVDSFCILEITANEASQAELDDISTLIGTNSLLTNQLIEKTKLIAEKDTKYINVLEMHYKERLENQQLKEVLTRKEYEIAELKKGIQEVNEKNFCEDLIQLDGGV